MDETGFGGDREDVHKEDVKRKDELASIVNVGANKCTLDLVVFCSGGGMGGRRVYARACVL